MKNQTGVQDSSVTVLNSKLTEDDKQWIRDEIENQIKVHVYNCKKPYGKAED